MRNLFTLLIMSIFLTASAAEKPNVIIVITDDQGYGDLGCHGNPILKTPHIDAFYKDALRLNNYHVDPTCAPTRSALMTGRYSDRVGVWHTIQGRNMLRSRETTMADVFKANGYATGIFGKWHLGDAYPYRPEDRGFEYVAMHGGGGIEQTPDYWGNDYFGDTYYVNGKWQKFEGYCTDVWFNQAKKFIKESKAKGKPFFSYITLNAPHGPKRAPKKYQDMYKENADFFGMITNIDDNFAALQKMLKDEGLEENTILIFTTDNGSAGGTKYHAAGMRGGKGSEYDGGHRVPFIMQWPKGDLPKGVDVDQVTAHLDILPTFIELLGLEAPSIEFDGTSLKKALYGNKTVLRNRTLVVESQRVVTPEKWRKSSVMSDRWRLVNGKELYDMKADGAQKKDVAQQYPEIVEQLRAEYDGFWTSVSKDHGISGAVILGSPKANPTTLTAHDLMGASNWSQSGIIWKKNKEGFWVVNVEKAGHYQISIRRWPAESDLAINATCNGNESLNTKKSYLSIAGQDLVLPVSPDAKEVTFTLELKSGLTELNAGFFDSSEKKSSANYVYVLNSDIHKGSTKAWQTREGLGLPFSEASKEFALIRKASKKKNPKKKK